MTKVVDSQALGLLNKALGLTGAGSPITELTDGVVDQVLDVTAVVRRSRTQAGTTGLYTAVLRHVHTIADTISTAISPYSLGTTITFPPFPAPMPQQFDIWLLGASISRLSGSGTISARLTVSYSASQQGVGSNDSGAKVTKAVEMTLAFWDTLLTAGGVFAVLRGQGQPYATPNLRLARSADTSINFRSVSSAASTFDLDLLLGVFPVSLGQDGVI